MLLLGLATSGPVAAVGLLDGEVADAEALGSGADRGRGVLVAVEALLARAGRRPADLAGVAVDVGPGSFTGVRVGVATAKAIAMGLSIPVVAVASLDALAAAAGPTSVPLLALRDARAGEAYFALYHPPGDDPSPEPRPARRLTRFARGTGEAVRRAVEERGLRRVTAVGEDAERLVLTLGLHGLLAGVRTPVAGPAEVLALALPRFRAGTTDDPDAIAPLYLQPSTPERRLSGEAR